MEKYYVCLGGVSFMRPIIVEEFDNISDAEAYAELMCRTKKHRYVVAKVVSEWNGADK